MNDQTKVLNDSSYIVRERIAGIDDLPELAALQEAERAGLARSTVLLAINERIGELTVPATTTTAEDSEVAPVTADAVQAAVAATSAADAPPAAPWRKRKWAGLDVFRCMSCQRDFFDAAEALEHAKQKHGYTR